MQMYAVSVVKNLIVLIVYNHVVINFAVIVLFNQLIWLWEMQACFHLNALIVRQT